MLDCEIGAITALNTGLTDLGGGAPVQVGVEGFAESAALATFDAQSDVPFVPSTTTASGASAVEQVARSLRLHTIGLYQQKQVTGGTNFDAAVSTALSAPSAQPTGPKWIVLRSDGKAPIAPATLSNLTASGVHLRSFAIGSGASCGAQGSLARLAAAGDSCVPVPDQSALSAKAIASQPAGIARVDVSVAGRSVNADVDPFGRWSAALTLPTGAYTATVTVTSPLGRTSSTTRSFTVATPARPAARLRPVLQVDTPAATYAALPTLVTGHALLRDPATRRPVVLNGARVTLQASVIVGRRARWVVVSHSHVTAGRYAMRWRPVRASALRVVLSPVAGVTGAVAAVPHPPLYACALRVRDLAPDPQHVGSHVPHDLLGPHRGPPGERPDDARPQHRQPATRRDTCHPRQPAPRVDRPRPGARPSGRASPARAGLSSARDRADGPRFPRASARGCGGRRAVGA